MEKSAWCFFKKMHKIVRLFKGASENDLYPLTNANELSIIKTVNETFVSDTRKEAGTMRYKNAELFPMIENFINQYREKYT